MRQHLVNPRSDNEINDNIAACDDDNESFSRMLHFVA